MVILGNGPSLAEDLPRLIARREYEAKDFMAVNFFAEDDRFEVVRPGYYVLSDPMFFRDSECRDRVAALYRTLDSKVTWPMTLYVQFYNPEKFDYRAALPNPRIRIVRFHTQVYRGFGSVGFWLFRHGLGSANFGTVVQVGEYVALLLELPADRALRGGSYVARRAMRRRREPPVPCRPPLLRCRAPGAAAYLT